MRTVWMILEDTMLGEGSQIPQATCCMILFL